MARDFKSGRNNTLKSIAEKKMIGDAPVRVKLEKLVAHPDNEYLFGMRNVEHMKRGIEKNGWKGAIEAWDLGDGRFMVYSGHTRWIAIKELGWDEIRTFIYPYPERESQRRRELLGANIYGRNSVNIEDPIHTARQIAYHRETIELERQDGTYSGDSDTREELAKEFAISPSQVYKYESLLKLSDKLQEKVANKEIQFGQASSMASLDKNKQEECWQMIEELREVKGENVTRNDIQSVIDYVKNPDGKTKNDDTGMSLFELPATNSGVDTSDQQNIIMIEGLQNAIESEEDTVFDGQMQIVNKEMDTKEVKKNIEKKREPVHGEQGHKQEEFDREMFIDTEEQDAYVAKFNKAFEKMENVLTEDYEYEDMWKNTVIEKLARLESLIKREKERLNG